MCIRDSLYLGKSSRELLGMTLIKPNAQHLRLRELFPQAFFGFFSVFLRAAGSDQVISRPAKGADNAQTGISIGTGNHNYRTAHLASSY